MTPSDTMSLREAARFFGFGFATLRAEGARGNLAIYRIGKRLYTTPADIQTMIERCRVEPKVLASTSIQPAAHGLSVMEDNLSALARAKMTVERLKASSQGTSPPNTVRLLRARR